MVRKRRIALFTAGQVLCWYPPGTPLNGVPDLVLLIVRHRRITRMLLKYCSKFAYTKNLDALRVYPITTFALRSGADARSLRVLHTQHFKTLASPLKFLFWSSGRDSS